MRYQPPCLDCRKLINGNAYADAGKGFRCEKCWEKKLKREKQERAKEKKNKVGDNVFD